MTQASLIFLHGASSAGKSTLARAVLPLLPAPFWCLSIDHLRDSGIWPMGAFRAEFDWSAHRARYFDGFHGMVAAALAAGNNVLLEHILDAPGWHADLARQLAGRDVFFVGLHTGADLLVEREMARGDRALGSAVQDAATVHQGLCYDLELDGAAPAESNARQLLTAWENRTGPSAFFEGA